MERHRQELDIVAEVSQELAQGWQKEGNMNPILNNKKGEKLPSKNTVTFTIRDEDKASKNKNRHITFSSDFDSGNMGDLEKIEDFVVSPTRL